MTCRIHSANCHFTKTKRPQYLLLYTFLVLLLSILTFSSTLFICGTPGLASYSFSKAVSSAMSELALNSEFQKFVSDNYPFSVPYCSSALNYPTTSPIPSSVKELVMCTHIHETFDVWTVLYRRVAQGIIDHLNAKYQLSLTPKYLGINTTTGYFINLKQAVDSEICDIVVSDTTFTDERSKLVSFASCGYGFSSDGFLRTELDNSTLTGIYTISQLNRADVKVSWYYGTIYDKIVNETLPLTQKMPVNNVDEQFQMVKQQQIHALISDAVDLENWRLNNKESCKTCYVKTFGTTFPFGVFTALKSEMSMVGVEWMMVLIVMILCMVNLLL
ncbi:hypothetical protein C9374_013572 [Naegleria lovaniensis]|uniref:Solute-binding protein family 3/N-terminal domain-containing protein n=1 Tax=Naegleria lovaniensis TaxID=51637 RepID=A0AA88H2P2_NAELO|nr:uncharacterized protein C9374_013572 [Naegleria lovaniensis]KAG2392087.1 hypothetical protein C9374_013572 [Naegleria lovaniensis]